MPVLTFKQAEDQPNIPGITRANVATVTDVQNQFVGFTYSAACSVVEVDILTGETKIRNSNLVYDVGWSLIRWSGFLRRRWWRQGGSGACPA